MEAGTKLPQAITREELQAAERGLTRLLFSKRFPREWIERHVPEAMAQAQADLAARMAAGREDDNVNLLVVIAYRKALKILRAQKSRPTTISIDEVFHLADQATRTPEQEALDHDRQSRLLWAIGHLQERDRRLLALVYFEEMSVREAGRRLGLGKSSADRHHQAALRRLRAIIGDRSLLGAEVALPAFIASGDSRPRGLLVWMQSSAEALREALAAASQRYLPLAESGQAAAMSGAGRTAAGVCGLTVAACLAAVGSTAIPLPAIAPHHPERDKAPIERRIEPSTSSQAGAPPLPQIPDGSASEEESTQRRSRSTAGRNRGDRPVSKLARPAQEPSQRPASAQANAEFGLEGEAGGEQWSQPSAADPGAASAAPPPPPARTPGASGSERSSSAEFGM